MRLDVVQMRRHTGLDSNAGIIHVATNVGEDLGLEAEVADGLAVEARLLTSSGRGELDVVHTKVVEGLGDLDLGLGVEEGVGELLALCKRDGNVWLTVVTKLGSLVINLVMCSR